jgi:hypothetical protein
VIVVGSSIQVFLIKKTVDGLACRIAVCLRKGEASHNRGIQMLQIHGEKR